MPHLPKLVLELEGEYEDDKQKENKLFGSWGGTVRTRVA